MRIKSSSVFLIFILLVMVFTAREAIRFAHSEAMLAPLLLSLAILVLGAIELARELRKNRHFNVIYMSGYSDVPAWLSTDAAGRRIIRKPFSPSTLANACRNVLDGSQE